MDPSPGCATTSAPKKKKKRITIVMDPCVNNIVNDIYFNKQATGNLANPSAIEEPSQNAEAKGTDTECEAGVDEQLSVSQSPIRPPAHAKSKSHKRCSKNTEDKGTDTVCFSSIEEPSQNAESKGTNTECKAGVDEQLSVSQSPIRPPAHAKSKSRKKKRRKISQHLRKNYAESKTRKGGSRLVLNQSVMETEGTNRRTCLVDAICGIIPVNEVKNSVRRSIIMAMPSQGDTSISHANNALASHGMVLNRASVRYRREGGAPFHLLQERKCRLVIQIKLTNHDNQKMCHFVSWDGHTIHDSPYNSKVNDTFDRASKKGSDNVFEKMYRRDFKNWQITNVYDLLDLNP